MHILRKVWSVVLVASVVWGTTAGQGAVTEQEIAEAVGAIGRYEFGESRQGLLRVEGFVKEAYGQGEATAAIEQALADLLASEDATLAAKDFACRQLHQIGVKNSLEPLATMLQDEQTTEMSCYALDMQEGAAIDAALREALGVVEGRALTAVVNLLGDRRDGQSSEALAALTRSEDPLVMEAAVIALGKIANERSLRALRLLRRAGRKLTTVVATLAYLQAGRELLARGEPDAAGEIFRELMDAGEPVHVRRGALVGLLEASGEGAPALVMQVLAGDDEVLGRVAIASVSTLGGGERVTGFLAERLSVLPAGQQVLLIDALAERGDASAVEAFLQLMESGPVAVQVAAIRAVGELGGQECVDLLVAKLDLAETVVVEAAGASLRALQGAEVNGKLAQELSGRRPEVQVQLIEVLADRRAREASPALIALAQKGGGRAERAAWQALGKLARGEDTEALLALLVKESLGGFETDAERAVAHAARGFGDEEGAEVVAAALARAKGAPARCRLLRVLGRLGSKTALASVREAAQSGAEPVQDEAVRVLAGWPTAAACDDLLAIFGSTDNGRHRVLALRGYTRLVGVDKQLSEADKCGLYRRVLEHAERADEVRQVLAGLGQLGNVEALRTAQGYLGQEAVRAEAALAVVQIAAKVVSVSPGAAGAGAKAVLAADVDAPVKEQAQAVLAEVEKYEGFVTAWQVSGPYEQSGKRFSELHEIAFGPEQAAGEVSWAMLSVGSDQQNGAYMVDLGALYGGSSRAAYLRTWVFSEKEQAARLEIGSDDGNKVWLNGEVVHEQNVARAAVAGQDEAAVTLHAGWNRLLVKVTQNSGPWLFCLRLRGPGGDKLAGVRVDAEHEALNSRSSVATVDFDAIEAVSLFDGETLAGWQGNLDIFRIEDGAIVAGSLERSVPRNEFLCPEAEYGDFELRFKAKLLGQGHNAGVQIRSRRVANSHEMVGYQVDMGQAGEKNIWGCLYDESRRGRFLAEPEQAVVRAAFKGEDWNEFVVRCVGPRVQVWLNGQQLIDYTEPDATLEQRGLIGLQIHGGPPSEAWYKDLTIKVSD